MNYSYWKSIYATFKFLGKQVEVIDFILSLVAVVIGLIWLISLIIYLVKKKKKQLPKKEVKKADQLKKTDRQLKNTEMVS